MTNSSIQSSFRDRERVYVSAADLAIRFAVGRTAIWGWLKSSNAFPRPVKLSPGTTRWKLSEVEAWEAAQEQVVSHG